MNVVSEDIKDMLLTASLGLTFAVNLFTHSEPVSPDNCVTVYVTPGFSPDGTLTKGEETWRPAIQVKVRNRSSQAAGALIDNIKVFLHNRAGEIWNGTRYTLIQCAQEPFPLGFDANNRSQWVGNFDISRQ
jgi:hypothetical protein